LPFVAGFEGATVRASRITETKWAATLPAVSGREAPVQKIGKLQFLQQSSFWTGPEELRELFILGAFQSRQ
jgi:hypothetical protein